MLIGAWWPARPDAPAAGVSYWRQSGEVKRQEASNLQNARTELAVSTATNAADLLERYWRGEQRVTTSAHQCRVESEQGHRVADAVNNPAGSVLRQACRYPWNLSERTPVLAHRPPGTRRVGDPGCHRHRRSPVGTGVRAGNSSNNLHGVTTHHPPAEPSTPSPRHRHTLPIPQYAPAPGQP